MKYIQKCLHSIYSDELIKKSVVSFFCKVLAVIWMFFFSILVTRSLGAETFGIFALMLTFVNIFAMLGRLGFDNVLIRFISEYSSKNKFSSIKEIYIKALLIVLPFSLFLSAVVYFSAPYIALFFNKPSLEISLRFSSFAIFPTVIIYLHTESLRGLKKIKEYALLQNNSIFFFSTCVLLWYMIFVNKTSEVPLISYLWGVLFTAFLGILFWLKNSNIQKEVFQNTVSIKNIIKIALPMLFSSSILLVIQWTDTLMLGFYRSDGEVGIYYVLLKLASITILPLMAINSIAAPKFAELYGKKKIKELENVVHQSTKFIFWSSFPILLLLLLFPSFILGLFGKEFIAGTIALIFLIFGQFINAISGAVGYFLNMTGKQNIFQNIILCTGFINVLLNLNLIPIYGINGAAFSSMISVCFWNGMCVFYIQKNFQILTLYFPFLSRFLRK